VPAERVRQWRCAVEGGGRLRRTEPGIAT
jgi:hypothetical protein